MSPPIWTQLLGTVGIDGGVTVELGGEDIVGAIVEDGGEVGLRLGNDDGTGVDGVKVVATVATGREVKPSGAWADVGVVVVVLGRSRMGDCDGGEELTGDGLGSIGLCVEGNWDKGWREGRLGRRP